MEQPLRRPKTMGYKDSICLSEYLQDLKRRAADEPASTPMTQMKQTVTLHD